MERLEKALQNPAAAYRVARGLLVGTLLLLYHCLFSPRVRIGFPFFVYGSVEISGPGSVSIGKGCSVYDNVHEGLSITTLEPGARVEIGERCSLGGLKVRARREVVIGDRSMTACCLVQDCLFFSREPSACEREAGLEARPIAIGENAWLGVFSTVLAGTKIGENAVIGAHALCRQFEVPANSVASGNPARRPIPIDKLLAVSEGS
jgi:acetyltransferase-like isoleucine patch superfamily enzyme